MVFDAPLVKAEQHGSIRVEKLTEVGMFWRSCCLAEQRLVPAEAPRHILHSDDRPRAFHRIFRWPNTGAQPRGPFPAVRIVRSDRRPTSAAAAYWTARWLAASTNARTTGGVVPLSAARLG